MLTLVRLAHRSGAWLLVVAGCGGSTPASSDAPPTMPSVAPSPAVVESPASSEPVASAVATANPPDTRVADACKELCSRKVESCPGTASDTCLASCEAQTAKTKGCDGEIAVASTCQAKAKQSPCGGIVASECVEAVNAMRRCQRGEGAAAQAAKKDAPAGWETTKDETWGVSMILPSGTKRDDATRAWKASVDGATFEIREQARPKEITDHALVLLVIGHVGVSCQKEMRVTGRVDTPKLTFARFETSCGKGARLFGKLRVDETRALSLVASGDAKPEVREAFLESIR